MLLFRNGFIPNEAHIMAHDMGNWRLQFGVLTSACARLLEAGIEIVQNLSIRVGPAQQLLFNLLSYLHGHEIVDRRRPC